MVAAISMRTEIEDLHSKRGLLERYRQCWEKELADPDLKPRQRAQIERDLSILRGVDEDLLRAEELLKRHKRSDNPETREEIVCYLAGQAPEEVPLCELCAEFGTTADRMRNLLRPLRASGHVVARGKGYVLGAPVPRQGVFASIVRVIGR